MGNANVYVKPQSMNVGLTFLLVMVTKQMHRTVLRKYKCLSQTDSVTFFLLSLFFSPEKCISVWSHYLESFPAAKKPMKIHTALYV